MTAEPTLHEPYRDPEWLRDPDEADAIAVMLWLLLIGCCLAAFILIAIQSGPLVEAVHLIREL